jgi:hypothetical protein
MELQTKLHNFSIAELMISKLRTTAKQRKITIHSVLLKEKKMPAATTINEIKNCILKFFSCNKQSFKPLNANRNDFKTLIINGIKFGKELY